MAHLLLGITVRDGDHSGIMVTDPNLQVYINSILFNAKDFMDYQLLCPLNYISMESQVFADFISKVNNL